MFTFSAWEDAPTLAPGDRLALRVAGTDGDAWLPLVVATTGNPDVAAVAVAANAESGAEGVDLVRTSSGWQVPQVNGATAVAARDWSVTVPAGAILLLEQPTAEIELGEETPSPAEVARQAAATARSAALNAAALEAARQARPAATPERPRGRRARSSESLSPSRVRFFGRS